MFVPKVKKRQTDFVFTMPLYKGVQIFPMLLISCRRKPVISLEAKKNGRCILSKILLGKI